MEEGLEDEQELKFFIEEYLGFKIPYQVYTKGHTSPFQMISEMYFEKVRKAIVMGSRNSSKTRNVSILNILDMLFKGVEVGLIAATKDQAAKGYKYLMEYLKKPEIRPYVKNSIKSHTEFVNGGFAEIHTGTVKGMNSGHPCKLSIDEVELIEYPVLEEGFSMTTAQKGFSTRDLLISTRKQSVGTMQRLLDNSEKMQFKIYKWNVFDVIQACHRQCFADKVHGDCPAWQRCQGAAHHVPDGGFLPIEVFIDKAATLTDHVWNMQWLCERSSEQRLVFNEEYFKKESNIWSWDKFLEETGFESKDKIKWEQFKHYGGIDFGHVFTYNHFVYSYELDKHFWVWEYYCNEDRLLETHADIINKNEFCPRNIVCWKYYDTAGKQEAIELRRYGVRHLCEANKSREAGTDALKMAFRSNDLIILEGAADHFLREKDGYVYPTDTDGAILSNNPEKGDDHSIDAARYGFYGQKLKLIPKDHGDAQPKRLNWLR